jgi:hypothetical protein
MQLFQQQQQHPSQHNQQHIPHTLNPTAQLLHPMNLMNNIPQSDWTAMSPSPACIERAMAATKALFDEVRTSLLDYFSEDALGLTQ